MYVLVNQEQLEKKKSRTALYNSMPDGRLIIPLGDVKLFGTLKGVDIIGSARELKELIREQEAGMTEEVDPGFSVNPEPGEDDVDPGGSKDPVPGEDGDMEDGETESTQRLTLKRKR